MTRNDLPNAPPVDESSATLFLPDLRRTKGSDSLAGWTPSPELRGQITRRLRLIAITYSVAFFFADIVPSLVMGNSDRRFSQFVLWAPSVGSILAGVLVAFLASSPRWSWQTKLTIGLAFEVVG